VLGARYASCAGCVGPGTLTDLAEFASKENGLNRLIVPNDKMLTNACGGRDTYFDVTFRSHKTVHGEIDLCRRTADDRPSGASLFVVTRITLSP
jgi:hypothetical protein